MVAEVDYWVTMMLEEMFFSESELEAHSSAAASDEAVVLVVAPSLQSRQYLLLDSSSYPLLALARENHKKLPKPTNEQYLCCYQHH